MNRGWFGSVGYFTHDPKHRSSKTNRTRGLGCSDTAVPHCVSSVLFRFCLNGFAVTNGTLFCYPVINNKRSRSGFFDVRNHERGSAHGRFVTTNPNFDYSIRWTQFDTRLWGEYDNDHKIWHGSDFWKIKSKYTTNIIVPFANKCFGEGNNL